MNATDFYVYEHLRPDTGAVFYVGKGKDDRARRLGRKRSLHHRNIVAKAGKPFVVVLQRGLSEHGAFALEKERVAHHRAAGTKLCNMTEGGEGVSGSVLSVERRAKFIAAGNAARKGSVLSAEHRAILLAANKGRVLSQEHRAKLSTVRKGRKFSPEHCANISAGQKDRKFSAEHRAKISAAAKLRYAKKEA